MSSYEGSAVPVGHLGLRVIRAPKAGVRGFLTHALPRLGLGREVNVWRLRNLPRVSFQFAKVSLGGLIARRCGLMQAYGRVTLQKILADGTIVDLGIAGYRVVTDAGVAKIVSFLNASDTSTGSTFKYHGFGTGGTAEAASQTALVTELTTQYAVDNTRPTGSQTTNGANVYRTVGTLSPDSGGTIAITEHGVFSATSAGTLLDRTLFSAVNLVASADSLQATYDLTLTSGS